jgi:hypothetical protein
MSDTTKVRNATYTFQSAACDGAGNGNASPRGPGASPHDREQNGGDDASDIDLGAS